jgi:hypothetical protein
MDTRSCFTAAASLAALVALISVPGLVAAQANPPPPAPVKAEESPPKADADADEARKKLEEEIQGEMERSTPPNPRPGVSQQAPGEPGAQPAAGGNPLARLMLLPDVSAIGSVSGDWNDESEKVGFAFEEVELGLQAIVDPYARADVFISFSDEGVDVEEAYLTTLALPAGLQLKAGKLFSPFGRLNQTHPHVQEFVDPPLAQRLLAEENLGGAGVAASWLVPAPWFVELSLAGQSIAPTADDEARLTGLARLSQYVPLGQATTLGVGVSGARRDEASGQFRDLLGADVYLRLRPPASRAYLTLSGEVHARRFVNVVDVSEDFEEGWWVQAFARLDPYWGLGARYEQAPGEELPGDEKRIAAVLAWLPSEFQRVRVEVSYDRLPDDTDAVGALLNVEFGIGAHGAHPF